MAKSMNVKAIASNLRVGEGTHYRLIVDGVEVVKSEEFMNRFAAAIRTPTSEAQFTIDTFFATVVDILMEAKRINLPFMSASLSVGGSVKSMTDQPTKSANPVLVNIAIKGTPAEKLAAIELKNVTITIDAALHEVEQIGASGVARLENENDVVVTGKGLMLNAGADDEGMWIEKDGIVKKMAEIKGSDHNEVRGNFGSLADVENGVYDLCVATRDGKNAADAPARVLKRKITVAK